jgi:alpha-methylacyl-CoA racemase
MLLGDWGADVARLVRPRPDGEPQDIVGDTLLRNRTIVSADLKSAEDLDRVLHLVASADILIEGFRPGVMERLGLGPDDCSAVNPRLIYGRMTGWGQDGPLASTAGHDVNYLSVTGMLAAIGEPDAPSIPLNLVGDFGGGSTFLVMGVLAALFERGRSGLGQVVDAAIVDGVAQLSQMIWSIRAMGAWQEQRSSNILDGGAPYYRAYQCEDGRHVAVGAVEDRFFEQTLTGLGLNSGELPDRNDPGQWLALGNIIAAVFKTRSRDAWCEIFAGTDACVTPVLTMSEALEHPHLQARGVLRRVDGVPQPMPAPRFARSRPPEPTGPGARVSDLAALAESWQPHESG